jgi:DNA modification methylase
MTVPWGSTHETIRFAVRAADKGPVSARRGNGAARLRQGSVIECPTRANLRHPTEKPVALLRRLVEASSLFGDLVLDPFAGSGSTLVAALVEGRRAVGVEISEHYCEIAAERLRGVERAIDAFDEAVT